MSAEREAFSITTVPDYQRARIDLRQNNNNNCYYKQWWEEETAVREGKKQKNVTESRFTIQKTGIGNGEFAVLLSFVATKEDFIKSLKLALYNGAPFLLLACSTLGCLFLILV